MFRCSRRWVVSCVCTLVASGAASTASAAVPSFATPTVASFFQTGFEPDLAVDRSPKTAGQLYTSTPFGFSTTQSFIFRSNDGGDSFHMVEGNVLGKPTTCAGGGDSELQIDPTNGTLFFSDLQGLTNFSNSVSTDSGRTWTTTCTAVNGTGVDRQWIGLDTAGGKSVGDGADAGRAYEDYDNVNQDTNADNQLGNQMVMNESVDGVHYGSNCQAAGVPCAGPPAVITTDEGIPGNLVVDNTSGPYRHRVYAVHTGSTNESVIVSWCSGKSGDTTAAQIAADCTDPTQVAPGDPGHVNVNWHDSVVRAAAPDNDNKHRWFTGDLFASSALDSAGNLYVAWSEYPFHVENPGDPVNAANVEDGPGVVKVAVSTDGGQHFSAPYTVSPSSLGNNVMPWVTAGSAGRIGIAWYGAEQAEENGKFGPDTLDHGVWNVYYAQSLDATSASGPHFTVVPVSDHPAKFGNISTQGLGGSPDRSLGDFMQVQTGVDGGAVISYVDDTSADRNPDYCQGCGQSPPEAAGPVMIAHQDTGDSLLADHTLPGGTLPFGEVSDPTGKGYPDAFLSSGDTDTNATPNLDVGGVKVSQPDAAHVTISMTTADPKLAQDLAVDSSTFQGSAGEWLVRWAAPQYEKPGDGNIFYVGMQAGQDGSPQFYSGTTCAIGTTHTKYFAYPTTTTVPGSVNGATITWTVPLANVGKPAVGQSMNSITGFTAVQPGASSASGSSGCSDPLSGSGDPQIPQLIDASPPFTYTIGGRSAQRPGAVTPSAGTGTACSATRGIRSAKVTPQGRGLRIAFTRRVRKPVTVDVFQTSHGRRILGMRLIARFAGRTRGLVWNGRATRRHHRSTDGTWFVRLRMHVGRGRTDNRRIPFERRHGRFHRRPAFFRGAGCGEVTYFKLGLPAFGGSSGRPLAITYRLRDSARVSLSVLRGKRVVRRFKARTVRQGRPHRHLLRARGLPRGNYRVLLRAVEGGGKTARVRLSARRL